jgi:hypothetical protein
MHLDNHNFRNSIPSRFQVYRLIDGFPFHHLMLNLEGYMECPLKQSFFSVISRCDKNTDLFFMSHLVDCNR